MKLSEAQRRYEAIMRLPAGAARDEMLSDLLDQVKKEFNVPRLQSEGWEQQNRATSAMYRKIANSRT